MLETEQFFDSLRGKLTTILLGTLTFGAVVPTVLDYASEVLYFDADEMPVWAFQGFLVIYFLLPALCVAAAWTVIFRTDATPRLLSHKQKRWVRWAPAAILLLLILSVWGSLASIQALPPLWILFIYWLVLCLIVASGSWLVWRTQQRLQRLRRLLPGLRPPTRQYLANTLGLPVGTTILCLVVGTLGFCPAQQKSMKAATDVTAKGAPYFATPSPNHFQLESISKSHLWQDQEVPGFSTEDYTYGKAAVPFLARSNYGMTRQMALQQDQRSREAQLWAAAFHDTTSALRALSSPLQNSLCSWLRIIVLADQSRVHHRPADCYAHLNHLRAELNSVPDQPAKGRAFVHPIVADALRLLQFGLEKQTQEYYSLLLGAAQQKGRLWLCTLLCLLLWGWAVLRIADEGCQREREARNRKAGRPADTVLRVPFQQETALLQGFAFIAFAMLLPLLRPVKSENIDLDKPFWSLTPPSFVRELVSRPQSFYFGRPGRGGASYEGDLSIDSSIGDITIESQPPLSLEELKKLIQDRDYVAPEPLPDAK